LKTSIEKYDKQIEMYSNTCAEQVNNIELANKKIVELEENLHESILESFDKEKISQQLRGDIEESRKLVTELTTLNNDYLKKIEELQSEKEALNKRYEETDASLQEFIAINEENVAITEKQKEEISALQEMVKFQDIETVQKISCLESEKTN